MCNLGVIGPMTVLHRCRLFLGSRLFLPLHRHHRQCRKDPVAGIQFHGHSSETPSPSAGAVHRTGPTKSGVSVLAKTPSRKPAACPVRFAVASFALLGMLAAPLPAQATETLVSRCGGRARRPPESNLSGRNSITLDGMCPSIQMRTLFGRLGAPSLTLG